MSHSNVKIWIHLIFSTKDRIPLINESLQEKLSNHIRHKLINDFNCVVEEINGYKDHLHILFGLCQNFALENIVQNIKGESSHWINQNNLSNHKFVWQTGYCAFSISVDKVDKVKNYIANQKTHHTKLTFKEEYSRFLKIYGIS